MAYLCLKIVITTNQKVIGYLGHLLDTYSNFIETYKLLQKLRELRYKNLSLN